MNKSTFFENIKERVNFLPIGLQSLHLDLGGDMTILLSHIDAKKNEKVIEIDNELFPSVFSGRIENSENFLRELSYAYDMIALTKIKFFAFFENRILYLITRQECPEWKKELIRNSSHQLLFDKCIFSSHEEIFSDLIIRKFGESSGEFGFFRFYNNEIFINTAFDKSYKADIYPDLFVFALKEFLENKYNVVIKRGKIPKLLEQHFSHNPRLVGKKNIKYELEISRLNGESKFIMLGYNEVSDALRPITKVTLYKLKSVSNSHHQSKFYFYSDIVWIKKFLKLVSDNFDPGVKVEFIDMGADKQNLFLGYITKKF